jgi:hypothetical protein
MASIGLELEPVSRPYTSGSSGPQVPLIRVCAFLAASSPRNFDSAFSRCVRAAAAPRAGNERAVGGSAMLARAPMPER